MVMVYPMQMLLAGFTLLLAFPFAISSSIATTSKEEIKCITCTPSPPPPKPECPPPPKPECPPPPSPVPVPPPPIPRSPPPPSKSPPPPSPQPRSPPPPLCPECIPPCFPCQPCFIICPPPCPGCPSPPCNVCQIPQGPSLLEPKDQQPGVMGGAVYSPPNEVVPYIPYSSQNTPSETSESAASSIYLEVKLVVSIIFTLLSVSFSFV